MFHKSLIFGCLLSLLLCLCHPGPALHAQSPDFVAHRGASHLAPENTLASLQLAWELGADAAECDVMLSSDDRILVFHDKNTGKLTGQKHEVASTPWSVLKELEVGLRESNDAKYKGETIPLLKEVLATIPEDRTLVIEIKTGPEILPFLKLVVDKHWQQGNIAFIAFDFHTISQCKAIYPEVPCYYLSMFGSDARKHVDTSVKAGLDGLNLRHAIINEKMVERCEEAGLDLWCWTVNDLETAKKMVALGISAITTDRPAWLKKELQEAKGVN